MRTDFASADGLAVAVTRTTLDATHALEGLARRLDASRGGLFSSGVDYPGRYSRWAFGFENPPLEFVGRGRRIGGRQCRESGTARGVLADRGMQAIVHLPRQIDGDIGRKLLRGRRAVRQNLDIDPGLVHLLQAQIAIADVMQTHRHVARPPRFKPDEMLGELGVPVMFLDRNDWTIRLLHHGVLHPLPLRRMFPSMAMQARAFPGKVGTGFPKKCDQLTKLERGSDST